MDVNCSVALDALSIVYMLILLYNLRQRARREPSGRRYFWLLAAISAFLALDIAYLLLSGQTAPAARLGMKAAKSLYFATNSLIVWLWASYIDHICSPSGHGWQKHRILFSCIFFADLLLVAANLFTGVLFSISPQGAFVGGPWAMWLFTLLNYLSILLTGYFLIRNRKNLKREQFYPLLLFPLPPFCAELVQIFFRPCSLLCTYAVSALLIFQVSQNATIYTDELTGLANRRLLDESLQKWFSAPRGAWVCCVMIASTTPRDTWAETVPSAPWQRPSAACGARVWWPPVTGATSLCWPGARRRRAPARWSGSSPPPGKG